MHICVGKRRLPCLFRKWLRTEGTWRIQGCPPRQLGTVGRWLDVVGEQCTRTTEMPGTHEEVGAMSVLWGRTRCSHSEDGANRDSVGRRNLRGGRMCVYGRG